MTTCFRSLCSLLKSNHWQYLKSKYFPSQEIQAFHGFQDFTSKVKVPLQSTKVFLSRSHHFSNQVLIQKVIIPALIPALQGHSNFWLRNHLNSEGCTVRLLGSNYPSKIKSTINSFTISTAECANIRRTTFTKAWDLSVEQEIWLMRSWLLTWLSSISSMRRQSKFILKSLDLCIVICQGSICLIAFINRTQAF